MSKGKEFGDTAPCKKKVPTAPPGTYQT